MNSQEIKFKNLIKKFELAQYLDCADLCAKKVIEAPRSKDTFFFYRLWLECLHEEHDVYGLQQLSLHLLKRRKESDRFTSLALIGLVWSGRLSFAQVVYRNLLKSEKKGWSTLESLALTLLEHPKPEIRAKGLEKISLVAKENDAYLTARQYFVASLQALSEEHIEKSTNLLNQIHPENCETLEVNASIQCSLQQWSKAQKTLSQLLALDKNNVDGILMQSLCYEKMGDLLAAKSLLEKNRHLFDADEYEWNINMGMLHKAIHHRYEEMNSLKIAQEHLSKAYEASISLGISTAPVFFNLKSLEKTSEVKGTTSQKWVVTLNYSQVKGLSSKQPQLINAHKDSKQGDIIFFTDSNERNVKLYGLTKIQSDSYFDGVAGYLCKIEPVSLLHEPIALKISKSYDISEEWQSSRPHAKASSIRWFSPSEELVTSFLEHMERETSLPEDILDESKIAV